jgi:hypothetical protein
MIQKDAFLVTEVTKTEVGIELAATAVAVDVDKSQCREGHLFFSDGTIEEVERLQSNSSLGTKERIQEDALRTTRLFSRESGQSERMPTPFWLLPVPQMNLSECSVVVKISDLSLFKTASFQLSCWSRLVWGTAFFGDPSTPDEHLKLAWNFELAEGFSIPVQIRDGIPGVLKLSLARGHGEFEASLFSLGEVDVQESEKFHTVARMVCEGMESSFVSELGQVLSVM